MTSEEEHLPILGVGGFIVSPQGTTAPLEHIEQRRDTGLVFEITLG